MGLFGQPALAAAQPQGAPDLPAAWTKTWGGQPGGDRLVPEHGLFRPFRRGHNRTAVTGEEIYLMKFNPPVLPNAISAGDPKLSVISGNDR
jgi:hypothetical protein